MNKEAMKLEPCGGCYGSGWITRDPDIGTDQECFVCGGSGSCPKEPAQQEPMAWLELLREARDNCKASIVEEGISASRKEYRIDLEARLTAALNSSPPAQRTWVGLTHDEYDAICDKHSAMSDFDFLGDIEAKLKEKNT